jgi:serine/threonine protein kinase
MKDEPHNLLLAKLQSRVGTMLRGKWRVDGLLGVGGMAAVYAATHRNGHRCAIKMLLPSFAANTEVMHRFAKEGYVANKVSHPGVVTVLDDDVTEDGAPFLVMELLQGTSFDGVLRQCAERCPIDPAEVMRIAFEVLDVLIVAHAHGIVHRDIKPENVFVLPDGRVKVLDFGIARMADAGHGTSTQMGAVMGTPAYMPPEQARGRWDEVDGQSDLWSVGALMFVALAQRPVHVAVTPNEELLLAMTEPPPPLRSVAPRVPLALADIVDRALALDKRSRWPDAWAMQLALGAMLGRAPAASPALAATEMALDPGPSSRGRAATDAILTATRSEVPPRPAPVRALGRWRRVALGAVSVLLVVVISIAARSWRPTREDAAAKAIVSPPALPPAQPIESPAAPVPSAVLVPIEPSNAPYAAAVSAAASTRSPVGGPSARRPRVSGTTAPQVPPPNLDPLNRRL